MLLSIIISVYNEAESLPALMTRLRRVLASMDEDYELVFVDDGSTDETPRLLENLAGIDNHIKVLRFSRNFGHQAAITAGLDFANGDAAVVMDADLQDPPELLPEMMRLMLQGYDVVSAQRQSRPGESFGKRSTAAAFYWFMRQFVDQRLAPEVGDFRLFSKKAVLALRGFREQHRFMRGLVAWLGLKEVTIPFRREIRANGKTKYPLHKMLGLAWTAVTSFSALPLRLSTTLGLAVTIFGMGYFVYSLFGALVARTTLPGWTSLICLQIIFSGTILVAVGMLGNYVARIYEESKQRPLYVIASLNNVASQVPPPRAVLVLDSVTPVASAEALTIPFRRARTAYPR
jgi:dolichol-phosphate mannosyltransferase